MQDRYAGDLGDFLKLGLLRWLVAPSFDAPPHRLGVVWYLAPDESHNADGKHIAYWARSDKWVLVIDGKELGHFDYPANERIFWTSKNDLRAFGESGNDCVRVDVTLPGLEK